MYLYAYVDKLARVHLYLKRFRVPSLDIYFIPPTFINRIAFGLHMYVI